MLKKTYRAFLVLGMAVGVVAGIFFLCSVQRQIADNAETAEIRRKNEQNAKIYLSPTMLPKEFEAADGLIPEGWQSAPVAESTGTPPARHRQSHHDPRCFRTLLHPGFLCGEGDGAAGGRLGNRSRYLRCQHRFFGNLWAASGGFPRGGG